MKKDQINAGRTYCNIKMNKDNIGKMEQLITGIRWQKEALQDNDPEKMWDCLDVGNWQSMEQTLLEIYDTMLDNN